MSQVQIIVYTLNIHLYDAGGVFADVTDGEYQLILSNGTFSTSVTLNRMSESRLSGVIPSLEGALSLYLFLLSINVNIILSG
jgi:hypothetical protein